jgi:predicted nucleotidyltransferase
MIRIRDLLRKRGLESSITLRFVCDELELTQTQGTGFLSSLEQAGYVVLHKNGVWELTAEGVRLRAANATKPLHRHTADRLLSDFLERVRILNADDHYLARVTKAAVFGSYLSRAHRLGDIDVAVQFARREADFDKHFAANLKRVQELGRTFSNMVEEMDWWRKEAYLFLRNRKRGLSIHDYDANRELVESLPHQVVFNP